MTTGSEVRGISSPGQSGSARMAAGSGRDDLDRQPELAQSASAAHGATASSDPVMLGIADERSQVLDQRGPVDHGHRRPRCQPRRIGRVMQVGPPEPLIPISVAGYVWTSQPAAASAADVRRVALRQDHDARPDGQHVAAERRELLVGHLDEPDARARRASAHSADRQQRQVDDREVVRDRRDHGHEVDELGRAAPVRDVEDPDVAADERRPAAAPPRRWSAASARCRTGRAAARTCRRPRSVPGRLDPADRRDAGRRRPGLDRAPARRRGSACPAGAGSRRGR